MSITKLIRTTICLYSEIVYLKESVDFYRKQGFHFQYFYLMYLKPELKDNSVYNKVIKMFKGQNDIIIKHVVHRPRINLFDLYENHYKEHKDDWIINCDLDEFIYSPMKGKSVRDIIKIANRKGIKAIHVRWRIFGDNNLKENPGFKVLKVYTKCAPDSYIRNGNGRSMVKLGSIDFENKSEVIKKTGHRLAVKSGVEYHNSQLEKITNWSTKTNKKKGIISNDLQNNPLLVCNHYQYKSKEECKMKHNNNQIKPEIGLTNRYHPHVVKKRNMILNSCENFEILKKI